MTSLNVPSPLLESRRYFLILRASTPATEVKRRYTLSIDVFLAMTTSRTIFRTKHVDLFRNIRAEKREASVLSYLINKGVKVMRFAKACDNCRIESSAVVEFNMFPSAFSQARFFQAKQF